jgi:hypothetical protein
LTIDGLPLRGVDVLWADIFQAVHRPDRLEVALLAQRGGADAMARLGLGRVLPGMGVTVTAGGCELFSGRVERTAVGVDRSQGRSFSLVAFSSYHHLRASQGTVRYYQTTDSEVAERIASSLELVAVVDPVRRVHDFFEQRGDPLRFLRRRARDCGRQLAVSRGKLYFSKRLPVLSEPLPVGWEKDLLSFELVARERAGGRQAVRVGSFEVRGNPRLRPLMSFECVKGLGVATRGRYHSIRVLHLVDADGYRTRVKFREETRDNSLRWSARMGSEQSRSYSES